MTTPLPTTDYGKIDAASEKPEQPKGEEKPAAAAPLKLEEIKDLERFRLHIWISKVVISMMIAVMFTAFGLFIYVTTTTDHAPDLTFFTVIFGHLKEVLVVVIGGTSPP